MKTADSLGLLSQSWPTLFSPLLEPRDRHGSLGRVKTAFMTRPLPLSTVSSAFGSGPTFVPLQ